MKRKERIITIDPSGRGTTALAIIKTGKNDQEIKFEELKSSEWKEQLEFIFKQIKDFKPTLVIYEDSHFLRSRIIGGLLLFKLIGAIEALKYKFEKVEFRAINVIAVKKMRKGLLSKEKEIENLILKAGRGGGWFFEEKKISLHALDCLIIYQILKEKRD